MTGRPREFDRQTARLVDHVEVADGVVVGGKRIELGAAGPLALGDVELDDARGIDAVHLLIGS